MATVSTSKTLTVSGMPGCRLTVLSASESASSVGLLPFPGLAVAVAAPLELPAAAVVAPPELVPGLAAPPVAPLELAAAAPPELPAVVAPPDIYLPSTLHGI
eukprot:2420973-Amphidinium_carterae.5